MVVAEKKNLRIVLNGDLKDRWESMLDRKRISQQDAIEALVELVTSQDDDIVQSALLGQAKLDPQHLKMAIERMEKTRRRGPVFDKALSDERGKK